MNNSVYQSYFDSAANVFLWRHCGLRTAAPEKSDSDHPVAFIVECKNQFFQPIMYPNVYMGRYFQNLDHLHMDAKYKVWRRQKF